MRPEECPHRSPVRTGEDGRDWIDCSATVPKHGRALPILAGACDYCCRGPDEAAKVQANFDRQIHAKGIVHGEKPPADLAALFPPPMARWPTNLTGWLVAILLAKRHRDAYYLPRTLASVRAAGWPDPLVVAEPDAPEPEGCRVLRWPWRMGCWGAGRAVLSMMLNSWEHRRVGAFLLLEDDVELVPGLRHYLDSYVLWPPGKLACCNLFLSSSQASGPPGWFPGGMWGGQALLFSRESLTAFLGHKEAARQQQYDDLEKNANLDARVMQWARQDGRQIWTARGIGGASLAAHRGVESSIWTHGLLAGDRVERAWAGDLIRGVTPPAWDDLAASRLTVCSNCPKFQAGACRCNLRPPGVVINQETVADPSLRCPLGRWGAVA